MPLDDDNVIEYLADNYNGPVASRGLWGWAGGQEKDVDYSPDRIQGWRAMWTKARDDVGPAPISIIREALFDHPGNPKLLLFLNALASEFTEEWKELGILVVAMLKKIGDFSEKEELLPVLLTAPDDVEGHFFAVLASAVNKMFSTEERDNLLNGFEELNNGDGTASASAVGDAVLLILQCIPELVQVKDKVAYQGEVEKLKVKMKAVAVADVSPPAEGQNTVLKNAVEETRDSFDKIAAIAKDSGEPLFITAFHVIERFFQILAAMAEGKRSAIPTLAAADCVHALWATRQE